MNEALKILLFVIVSLIGFYWFGRLFMKGVFHEIDLFLGKKFIDYINTKKSKEDGKEKE